MFYVNKMFLFERNICYKIAYEISFVFIFNKNHYCRLI